MNIKSKRLLSTLLAVIMVFSLFAAMPLTANAKTFPNDPTNLRATLSSNGTSVTLNWEDNSTVETGYIIHRKESSVYIFSEIATVPANTTTFVDTTMLTGRTYVYSVQATNNGARSESSNEVTIAVPAIPAPSHLDATVVGNGIKLDWRDNSNNEEKFSIYRKEGSGSFTGLASVGANVTTYTDTTAQIGKTYSYYVVTVIVGVGGGDSKSNEATATRVAVETVAAPSNLTATSVANGIKLSWTDNSNNEESFSIYRKEGSGSFTLLLSVAANVTTYTDTTAQTGKTYTYYVRPVKVGVGSDSKSNEATATMGAVETVAAPSNLTAASAGNGIKLNWVDNSNNEEMFSIYRKEGSGSFTLLLSVAANVTTYTDTTAQTGKTYTYYIRPVNVGFPIPADTKSNEATATMGAVGATINPTTVTYNKSSGNDISVTVDLAGYTPQNIKNGSNTLQFNTDYAISGNTVTFKTSYLSTLAVGIHTLTFEFSGGTNPTLTITVTAGGTTGAMSNFVKVNTYTRGQFTDVNETLWYGFDEQKVIATAYEYGLMLGTSDTLFDPTGNVTIAQAITMASRVHKIYTTGNGDFVQGSVWYQVYVDYAIANNIIAASDFTDYNKAATRAEMAYIFSKALPAAEFASQNTVNSLPDVNNSTPYYSAIFMLYKAGVLAGSDTQGTFNPSNNITRAEAAAIISRVILPATRFNGNTF